MATLNSSNKRKKAKIMRFIFSMILFTVGLIITPYIATYIDQLLKHKFDTTSINVSLINSFHNVIINKNIRQFVICIMLLVVILIFYINTISWNISSRTKTIKITDNIEIPIAVGEGQFGTSRFMKEEEKDETFFVVTTKDLTNKKMIEKENLGLVVSMKKYKDQEIIRCIVDDRHSLLVGSTRSGKTRHVILETIWLRAHCGKSMIINDPKGELFLYSKKYLESQDYNIIDIDFRQPLKSKCYNYMHFVNKAIDENNIPKAIDETWDLVSVIVGKPKGEPLWTNGEASVIASIILIIATEAPNEYRNLPNVYYFLSYMCKSDEYGDMLITKYLKKFSDEHPAKMVFAVAEISPYKMRGSFFGSALATLRLFSNWNIANMTSTMEVDVESIVKRKTAVFIIVPDEKDTYYSLVTLLINQMYTVFVDIANKNGGRVPLEVEYELDEFGQLPIIPSFGSMLSVGAGRGIRFNLAVQNFEQIKEKYEKSYQNIKSNCQTWIYLRTASQTTREEISKMLDRYTVQVNSVNNSVSDSSRKTLSYSDSANMQSRSLLTPGEVGRINRPYMLVMDIDKNPAMMVAPDISYYRANKDFGMGNKKHNIKLQMQREGEREQREPSSPKIWDVWNHLKKKEPKKQKETISFLK